MIWQVKKVNITVTWKFLRWHLKSPASTVYSGADQRKHQSSMLLAFVWGIHPPPVNSPHKWPVMRKMFPFDDVISLMTSTASPTLGYINYILLKLFHWSSCQYFSTGSDNVLVTNRQQVITWTNYELVVWHLMALPGHKGLSPLNHCDLVMP